MNPLCPVFNIFAISVAVTLSKYEVLFVIISVSDAPVSPSVATTAFPDAPSVQAAGIITSNPD